MFSDANCDGVDGVVRDSIFVRAGAVRGDGSQGRPFGSITEGLNAVQSTGKRVILVSEGFYNESVRLMNGVFLHGGYSRDFKSRDLVSHASVIRGNEGSVSVYGLNISVRTVVSGFVIEGPDLGMMSSETPGIPSVGVWFRNSSAIELRSNRIVGGRGGSGLPGLSGSSGYGRKESSAVDGKPGVISARVTGPCQAGSHQYGGGAGINARCVSANGIRGGNAVCPVYDWSSNLGGLQEYPNRVGGRGGGGRDWSFDELSGVGCSHATESGFPSEIGTNTGERGQRGRDGSDGRGGAGGSNNTGMVRNGFWMASRAGMHSGADGSAGGGGGGGGAGGGVAYFYKQLGDCEFHEMGPSGGGGGAGGCGGAGGGAGGQGGASIGVMVGVVDGFSGALPVIRYNLMERGFGGDGGDGGVGGAGGLGGNGGEGGRNSTWISTKGGGGGDGGNGGTGGGGGGGSGGPSFDFAGAGVKVSVYLGTNRFLYQDSADRSGRGGSGGRSTSSGAHGGAGNPGANARVWEF